MSILTPDQMVELRILHPLLTDQEIRELEAAKANARTKEGREAANEALNVITDKPINVRQEPGAGK